MLRMITDSNKYLVKAFGKFYVNQDARLRSFEKYFNIKSRTGVDAWKSQYTSIQNLLNHLSRHTQSDSSREKYLQIIQRFCIWSGFDPDELSSLPQANIEVLIQRFIDELAEQDRSRAYLNSLIKRLKTFFRLSGHQDLQVATYFLPARYRKMPEYIPSIAEIYAMAAATSSSRDRAIILGLWSSGLRVSTFAALNYGDIAKELEQGEPYILIPVYPDMKTRVPNACKGRIAYYTFISPETGEALRSYVRKREETCDPLNASDPLLQSKWTLWKRSIRPTKRLGRRGIGLIVKTRARLDSFEDASIRGLTGY